MTRKSCWSWTLATALLGLSLAGQARATTFTLQEVIDTGGFTTANGLTFSGFAAAIAGDIASSLDNDDLLLTILSDGFTLSGPINASDGEIGDILLSFSVTAVSLAQGINGASLLTNGVASGVGAQVAVDELILGLPGEQVLGLLSAFDTGANPGDAVFADALRFGPQLSIRVAKDILVDSALIGGGTGGSARVSLIEQRFSVVPEPGTFGMLGFGLSLLAVLGRRRS